MGSVLRRILHEARSFLRHRPAQGVGHKPNRGTNTQKRMAALKRRRKMKARCTDCPRGFKCQTCFAAAILKPPPDALKTLIGDDGQAMVVWP